VVSFVQPTGSSIESIGMQLISIRISPALGVTSMVTIKATNGLGITYGTLGDYTTISGLTSVGDSIVLNTRALVSIATFIIVINDDNIDESNENIAFEIVRATGNTSISATNRQQIFTIINNDTTIVRNVNFAQATQSAVEDAGTATVQIALNGALNGAGQIVLKANRGTELSSANFSTTPALIINLTSGLTQANFTINIIDDTLGENDETVNFVIVRTSPNINIGSASQLSFTIIDNDSLSIGIKELFINGKAIKMYPNPNNIGILHFSDAVDAEIMDIQGKQLISVEKTTELNLHNLAKGVYIIKIEGTVSRKLIIE